MKKLEILAFSAFSAFICAAAFAEPQNVVDRIEETRGTVKTAFDELDKARNFLSSANSIFKSETDFLREKNSNFALMEDIFSSIKRSKEDLKKEISSFKIRFDADVKNFKDAKTTLEEIEKILPLARKKIESINAAIEKMRAEVAKQPGNMYQNKREFQYIETEFAEAAAALEFAQQKLSEVLVNISVAEPKIEGVPPALKLAEDYIQQFDSIEKQNEENIRDIKEFLEKLTDEYLQSEKSLAKTAGEVNGATKDLMATFAKLSDLMYNKIPASKNYKDAEFKRLPIFSAPGKIAPFKMGNYRRSNAGNNDYENSFGESVMKNKNEALTAMAVTNNLGNKSWQREQQTEKLSVEFSKISDASFEIREITQFLLAAIDEANSCNNIIDSDISKAQDYPKRVISYLSTAQSIKSSVQTAQTTNKILQSRRGIFESRFEKLLKEASEKVSEFLKKSEAASDSIENISNEL